MLFTRCPECQTTFRVTDETLKRAHGQVRCGRCSTVFNAHAERREASAPPTLESADPAGATEPQSTVATTEVPAVQQGTPASATPPAVIATTTVAEVVAELEASECEAAASDDDEGASAASRAEPDAAISPKQVDAVLAHPSATPVPAFWLPPGAPQPVRRSRWWGAAAALALVALGGQALYHYRSELATHASLGPWVERLYATVGATVSRRPDARQYAILDWVATAEPSARGRGSLKITARIQNRAALAQPYPAVQLRLKDRWEDAVGSRVFSPSEYLPKDTAHGPLMSPGETAHAEIEVVDPGPDAQGFELDVCVEVETSLLTCGTDEVFL